MVMDIIDFWCDFILVVGSEMIKIVFYKVYEVVVVFLNDIDVIELYDCFIMNEIIIYEVFGLCFEGEVEKFVIDWDNIYGGKYVVGLLGGLMLKGYFIGVMGIV